MRGFFFFWSLLYSFDDIIKVKILWDYLRNWDVFVVKLKLNKVYLECIVLCEVYNYVCVIKN